MIKKIMLVFMIAFTAVSCGNDLEDVNLQRRSSTELSKDGSIVEYEDLFSTRTKTAKVKTRANDEKIVEDELVVTYGTDKTESVKKTKIALNTSAAAKFGLAKGIYIVEYLLCYKNVYKPGYDIWSEKSENCGYIPSQDFVLGNTSILATKERGYEEPASNTKELKTFVYHVISNSYGQRVDRYDPCAPKDIEWKYFISPQ